jgi:hypothetical protein
VGQRTHIKNPGVNITEQFIMKILPLKSKVMAFKGDVLIRNKILTGTVLEQANTFTYLGSKI